LLIYEQNCLPPGNSGQVSLSAATSGREGIRGREATHTYEVKSRSNATGFIRPKVWPGSKIVILAFLNMEISDLSAFFHRKKTLPFGNSDVFNIGVTLTPLQSTLYCFFNQSEVTFQFFLFN